MTGYLLSIVAIVLFCGVICAVMPEGKMAESVKGACKLAILAVLAAPVVAFISGGKKSDGVLGENSSQSVIKLDLSFIDYCCERRIKSVESQLLDELQKENGNVNAVQIEWRYESDAAGEGGLAYYDETKIKITKICIFITGETQTGWQGEKEVALETKYGCEVEFCTVT